MKPLLSVVLLCAVAIACARNIGSPSRKAWEQREALDTKGILAMNCDPSPGRQFLDGGDACRKALPVEKARQVDPVVREARWENFTKEISPRLPSSADIISVGLTKTVDTHQWVIRMEDANGHIVSYWLDSGADTGGYVHSISPY